MRVTCPTCNNTSAVPSTSARVACPHCGRRLELPASAPRVIGKAAAVEDAVKDDDDGEENEPDKKEAGSPRLVWLAVGGVGAAIAAVVAFVVVSSQGGDEGRPAPPQGGDEGRPAPPSAPKLQAKASVEEKKGAANPPPKVDRKPNPERLALEAEKERLKGSLSRIRARIVESARETADIAAGADRSIKEAIRLQQAGRKYLVAAKPLVDKIRSRANLSDFHMEECRHAEAMVAEQQDRLARAVNLEARSRQQKEVSRASHERLLAGERGLDRQLKAVTAKLEQ